MKQTIITIEKLDGTIERIKADLPNEDHSCNAFITAIGYCIFYDNGRQMIIHPNSVYRIIIDEVEV